jgi:peptidoglycan/LPS O-acetylase OafA/YrhL
LNSNTGLSVFPDSKSHYDILDGLRGVAAVMVVAFHLLESHATSHFDQMINHGYLAVDFFYVLSGFVIGYAYDDRWGKMTLGGFFKRRLIRLHPMIILGTIIGAILFYFQGRGCFSIINEVPVWKMLLIMLLGFTLLPLPKSMDIRGWAEMHPLDGPAWSLFFEYIANIFYGLFVRRFSKLALSALVVISGYFIIHLAVTHGDVVGGWSLDATQLHIGLSRLMYPFFAGLLLSRIAKLTHIKHAFLWCSLLIILVLAFPRVGDKDHIWMNGIYESLCIVLIFPLIVYLGASGEVKGKFASKVCKFLGDISYPLYITHYPIVYTYMAWVTDKKMPISESYPMAIVAFVASIILSFMYLRFYDVPMRKWLTKRFMTKPGS